MVLAPVREWLSRLLQTLTVIAALVLITRFDSEAQSPPTSVDVHFSSATVQTNEFVFFDSNSNRFATVTAILPVSITREPTQGKWRGELSSTYVRPLTNVVLTSDKLRMTNWHTLVCKRDTQKPSRIVIELHPDQPDDYVSLDVPTLSGTITGRWYYGTDGGLVDSGILVGSIHK